MTTLPDNKIAIFWDYENFQLPRDIPAQIFFSALFPDSDDLIITKRVYGKKNSFSSDTLQALQNNGFSYIEGLPQGKLTPLTLLCILTV